MNYIIIGLRRSGTTILYDCLSEDKRFDSYYEPFRGNKNDDGGVKIFFVNKINYG